MVAQHLDIHTEAVEQFPNGIAFWVGSIHVTPTGKIVSAAHKEDIGIQFPFLFDQPTDLGEVVDVAVDIVYMKDNDFACFFRYADMVARNKDLAGIEACD
jgi:hypothetical protein